MGGHHNSTPQQQTDAPARPAPYLRNTSVMNLPQAMPGQLESIASSLAAGGFGPQQDFYKYLDQQYAPVQSLAWNIPPSPPPGTPSPPTSPRRTPSPPPPTPPYRYPGGRNSR